MAPEITNTKEQGHTYCNHINVKTIKLNTKTIFKKDKDTNIDAALILDESGPWSQICK